MKKGKERCFACFLTFVFVLGVCCGVALAQMNAPVGPTLMVNPVAAPIDRKAKVVIMGSGFEPGQEISVLFEDNYGALSVLAEVKANERGSWATAWTLGRYTRRGIIEDGVYAIMAADQDYNTLASCPVGFVKATGDPEKWPKWGKAAGIKAKKKKPKKK
jgi:hypothetical protein